MKSADLISRCRGSIPTRALNQPVRLKRVKYRRSLKNRAVPLGFVDVSWSPCAEIWRQHSLKKNSDADQGAQLPVCTVKFSRSDFEMQRFE